MSTHNICFIEKSRNLSQNYHQVLLLNSFGAKFQTTFVVCFFYFDNYPLERPLCVKLKDRMSNSIDPDEMAQ